MRTRCSRRLFLLFLACAACSWLLAATDAGRPPATTDVPGVVIDHCPASSGAYIGSPGIAVLPGGEYAASHDLFGPGTTHDTTRVFGSKDRGRSWEKLAEVKGQFWSSLFVHRNTLYLLGTSRQDGYVVIRRSVDGGRSWTTPADRGSGLLLDDAKYHCAPVPIVEHAGRVWRAMEDVMGPGGWGSSFRSFMMSAPVGADLLRSESWTVSERLGRNAEWLDSKFGGWLEGNAVVAPTGRIVTVLRADYRSSDEKAAVIEISEDGKHASFDPRAGFVDFPGGCKKFSIRRDPRGDGYWSLTNFVPEAQRGSNPERTRNTLALVHSKDLKTWEVRGIVLEHPDAERHAFQYADWQFDGDDLIAVSRTAFDDAEGGAHSQHDANYLTFHRIEKFRERKLAVSEPSAQPRALVLVDDLPGLDASLARRVAADVEASGYIVEAVNAEAIASTARLDPSRVDLLVVTAARTLPAASMGSVERYLRGGGDIIALGLPAWQDPLVRSGSRWIQRSRIAEELAKQAPDRVLADFNDGDVSRWTRATNAPASRATKEAAASDRGKALHVVVDKLTGWDTLASPPLVDPFASGRSLTCFRAKGAALTDQLALEWVEVDGSRWIAVVDLKEEWRSYALRSEDFRPWQPPPGRGGKGDRLRVERAKRFTVGVAQTHTTSATGRQEYWLDDLGTGRDLLGNNVSSVAPEEPRLETISPAYLFFPASGVAKIETPAGLALAAPVSLERPQDGSPLEAMHPRPGGAGFEKGRVRRWQPLLEARAADGDHRGTLASILVHAAPPFRGGVWAAFTPADAAFYGTPAVSGLLREVASRMRRGVFLLEGGSELYTVFEEQSFRFGARVVSFGKEMAKGLAIRISLSDGTRFLFERRWDFELEPGAEKSVEAPFKESRWPSQGLVVTAELLDGSTVIDRLSHELHAWRPPAKPSFVKAHDGGLWLDGKPWKAHGVNYMPSSGVGLDDQDDFEHWLGSRAYDPEVIDRDLRRIRSLGMNALSVFVYHRSIDSQNLLDFLRRCEVLGLKVNQSLRPGTPMDFRWQEMKALIERYRLADNDTVLAYDLAWEPSHFDEEHQKSYVTAWEEWVRRRYGGVEAAEKRWGVPAPRAEDRLTVPSMKLLTSDGEWRKLAADYRAFLDDLLREKYSEARRLVRTVDSRHPVSFRMQFAGDPTHNTDRLLPYDFFGLAEAVDIWEPEAYGRVGDWDRVKAGRFTADYARLCDASKPLVWAEAGYDVWDKTRGAQHPQKLEVAAKFYADFYRMLRESGADGVFFWWYPGGYRLNEGSDFGILNPDGTDRALTRVIREEGPRFLAAPKPPAAETWISVDRDRDARGLFGIYERVKDVYWKATAEGKTPGLRWERPPGGR